MSQGICNDCGHPLPNDTGEYCPTCGATRSPDLIVTQTMPTSLIDIRFHGDKTYLMVDWWCKPQGKYRVRDMVTTKERGEQVVRMLAQHKQALM